MSNSLIHRSSVAAAWAFAALLFPASAKALVIDFDALPAGAMVTSSDLPAGYGITTVNKDKPANDVAIIFDSDCPGGCTGGDGDLRTPGIGLGNNVAQHKILIVPEDLVDVAPANGLIDDPDDEQRGGTITFTFPAPQRLLSVRIIDIDTNEPQTVVRLALSAGGTLALPVAALGNNSGQTIVVPSPVPLIDGFTVDFQGSGGIDDIIIEDGCGDGVVDPGQGEECDPPDGVTCDENCQEIIEPPPPVCGNDKKELGEQCDGTDDAACPDLCRSDCTCKVCGDGIVDVDAGEECDDGGPSATCDANCQAIDQSFCGDDTQDEGEQCDGTDDATCPGLCRSDCTCKVCGDNIVDTDAGETCDGTDATACPGLCRSDCTCKFCGDGIIDTDAGEECDDGGPSATCDANCQVIDNGGVCGDNVKDDDEDCDGTDSSACPGLCRSDCTCKVCGDGIADTDAGEQCDGADASACGGFCRSDCQCPICGDGRIDPGEQCEPPGAETCNNDIDDNNNTLIDCADTAFCPIGVATCSTTCQNVPPCAPVEKDPAIIRFDTLKNGADYLSVHGNFVVQEALDLTSVRFGIRLSNASGDIYQGTLAPEEFRRRKGGKGRFMFKDNPARNGGPGDADGLYKVSVRVAKSRDDFRYVFRVRAYGDLSAATDPFMTLQVVAGAYVGVLEAEWKQTGRGWILRQSDFR